jgi:hypothetical protein
MANRLRVKKLFISRYPANIARFVNVQVLAPRWDSVRHMARYCKVLLNNNAQCRYLVDGWRGGGGGVAVLSGQCSLAKLQNFFR